MKKILAGVGLIITVHCAQAQNAAILFNGTTLQGSFRNDINKTGMLTYLDASSKKQQLSASQVKECSIDQHRYISYKNDFFEVVTTGNRYTLYQKVTDNDGKLTYNGTEATVMQGSEGRKGEYFISVSGDPDLTWLKKKEYVAIIKPMAKDCQAVLGQLESGKTAYTELPALVGTLNNCQ